MKSSFAAWRNAHGRVTPLASALALTLFSGISASSPITANPVIEVTRVAAAATVAGAETFAESHGKGFVPADQDNRAVYTVILKEPALAAYEGGTAGLVRIPNLRDQQRSGRIDVNSVEAQNYITHLKSTQTGFTAALSGEFGRNVESIETFQHALNAVVLRLSEAEAEALRQRGDVQLVARERQRKLNTYASPTFIGAANLWNDTSAPNGVGYKGEGVVVGVIDSGVNYLSNSFKVPGDDGYTPVNPLGNGNYLGLCVTGATNAGHCNSKLIGIYNTESTAASRNGRDLDGHGSHTASTAAGGVVNNATFSGGTFQVSGMAPHANVITYLACYSSCTDTTLIAAINQAVANGIVDVINYSIGGPNDGPWLDATDQAYLNAMSAGIFVATAAGNDGPNENTTDSYAPWYTSVGATTPGAIPGFNLTATGWGGSATLVPGSSPFPAQGYTNLPLIESPTFSDGANDGCSAFPANYFRRPQTAAGAQGIAVLHLDQNASNCASGARRTAAANAGAIAVVYVDPEFISLGATGASYALEMANWNTLKAAVGDVSGTTGAATASISYPIAAGSRVGDIVTGFSSRGPTLFGTLKPDVSAPGDTILAAISPTAATGYTNAGQQPTTRGLYGTISGTSMASPHVAGAAALVRQVHRDWTPMEVKSALMSTAKSALTLADGSPANPNQRGAGRIDPSIAARAGLVFNETAANFQAANPTTGGQPQTLNLASYYHTQCAGTCVFPRTVKSTGKATTWAVAVSGLPAGSYTLNKTSFVLGASGSTSYSLSVNSTLLTPGSWYYGELTLTPSDPTIPTAHLPIALRAATARLAADTSTLAASLVAGTSATRSVVISNAGNPTLNWSIPTTTLKGSIVKRKASTNGLADRTVVTAATTTAIDSTNANNSYGADWFDIYSAGTTLAELQMDGFGYTSSTATYPAVNTFATQLAWRVWGDNNGVPNGRPGSTVAGDVNPVFQFPAAAGGLPATGAGLSFPGDGIRIDLAAAGATSPPMTPGRYWLNVAPSISGTGTVFYQLLTQEAGKTLIGQYALPNSTTTANKAWRATNLSALGGAGYTGYAMEVVVNATCSAPWLSYSDTSGSLGLAGNKPVTVNFDASSLTAGTYTAYVCISGNGTSPPFMGFGGDSLLIPVTLTVTAAPTAIAATGAAAPSTVPVTTSTLLTVSVTPGSNPTSTGISVNGNLSAIGGSAAQTFYDDGSHGDATAGDGVYSFAATVAGTTLPGSKTLPITVSDAQSRTGSTTINLDVPAQTVLSGSGSASPDSVAPGGSTTLSVTVTPGANPDSTGIQVSADLSSIGGSATQAFTNAGGNTFTVNATVDAGITAGVKLLPATISDNQGHIAYTTIGLAVTTNAPSGPLSGVGLAVPGAVLPGDAALLLVAVTPASGPASSGIGVTADLSAIGLAAAQMLYDDGTNGDQIAGDGIFSLQATLNPGTPIGAHLSLPVAISDAQLRAATASIALETLSDRLFADGFDTPDNFVAPTLTKGFAPDNVAAGASSKLTITLVNANTTAATLASALTDTFPSGLVVANTPNAATTCSSGKVAATTGAGSVSLSGGAQIPPNGNCTVTVDVRATAANAYNNLIAAGALQTNFGSNAAAASATLTVTGSNNLACSAPINHVVSATTTGTAINWITGQVVDADPTTGYDMNLYGATGLTMWWTNAPTINAGVAPSTTSSDYSILLPGTSIGAASTWSRTNGTMTAWRAGQSSGYFGFRFNCASLGTSPSGTCYGYLRMQTTATTGHPATLLDYCYDKAGDTIVVPGTPPVYAPTVSKAFAPASVAISTPSTLTITLANSNPSAATLNAALVDTFPSGLVAAPTPAASTTCPNGTANATAGTGSVSLSSNAQIPANGSCTVSVSVQAASTGSYVNTIAAGALQTSAGNNATAASATLNINAGGSCSGQFLQDTSFEASTSNGGTNPFWGSVATNGPETVFYNQLPRTGTWSVWFGGYGVVTTETHDFSQSVTIPTASSATLKYWRNIGRAGVNTNTVTFTIDGNVVKTEDVTSLGVSGWTEQTVDVSAYANGGTHLLKVTYAHSGGGQDSNYFLDDITLDCGG